MHSAKHHTSSAWSWCLCRKKVRMSKHGSLVIQAALGGWGTVISLGPWNRSIPVSFQLFRIYQTGESTLSPWLSGDITCCQHSVSLYVDTNSYRHSMDLCAELCKKLQRTAQSYL